MADNQKLLWTDKAIGAMLGAACGDALGWPNERMGRSTSKRQQLQNPLHEFKKWSRRTGGRFYPYEETIDAGEYSDDTQLILCLARSLLHGNDWWDHWTKIELPFWTLYERGGGGATKRAADAWIDGNPPWSERRNPKDIKRYFEAGGDGVAMRVLPHVLHLGKSESFAPVALSIFKDGIATHGHPRALLGALAYGYALWKSFNRETRLEYGGIIDELIFGIGTWSRTPELPETLGSWLPAAKAHLLDYEGIWQATISEMKDSFTICKNELSKGALAFDDEVLHRLKCFDGKVSGAGTVAAAASVFLASRYAPDPMNGVIKAAFAIGSDTDTIASMAGGILGLICGADWLSSSRSKIQDSKYIILLAQELVRQSEPRPLPTAPTTGVRPRLRKWLDNVTNQSVGCRIEMPDNRSAVVRDGSEQIGRSGKYKVEIKKLETDDGQSLYITRISKGTYEQPSKKTESPKMVQQQTEVKRRGCGSKIPVTSLEKAMWFYRDCLGLTVKKKNGKVVVFDQGLVLVPSDYATDLLDGIHLRAILYIQATDIKRRFGRMKENKIRILSPLAHWGKSRMLFFRSLDPDGNVVEVFSADSP